MSRRCRTSSAPAVRRFAERGGALIATGVTSLYTEGGDARPDFALADLFGAQPHRAARTAEPPRVRRTRYLRLTPEQRGHAVLAGFDETDILAFGGTLEPLRIDAGATVPLTFIPPFPIYPPETSWMRTPKTDIPGLVLRNAARLRTCPPTSTAATPATICPITRACSPTWSAGLRGAIFRWPSRGAGCWTATSTGSPGGLILHLVNLTNPGTWRAPIDEYFPVGPLDVRVKLPAEVRAQTAQLRVSGGTASVRVENGWAVFRVDTVVDHEVAVLGE